MLGYFYKHINNLILYSLIFKLTTMKKIFTIASLLICAEMYAQKCSDYLFLQSNKTVEMTIYNKKGEEHGKQIYTVSNVTNTSDVTIATLNSEMFDKKGK